MSVDQNRRPSGSGTVARFSVEISQHITLKELRLRINERGAWRISAPNVAGANVADISPELAREITAIAIAAFNEQTEQEPHDCRNVA